MPFLVRSNLRQLIIVLAFLSALISVFNMFLVGSKVQKEALIHSSLENNQAYAAKLAASATLFLDRAQSELKYSADQLGKKWLNPKFLKQEAQRLAEQSNAFNSVIIANDDGLIRATSHNVIELANQTINSVGMQASLLSRKPVITTPYESTLNKLIITISSPIFDSKGTYLGFVAAAIHLKDNYLLKNILGIHYQKDDSFTYVVDSQKRFLYHPNENLIGQVAKNPLIDHFFAEKNGNQRFVNSQGKEMLGGFAFIPVANWLVLSQRPLKSAIQAHEGLMLKVFVRSLPITLTVLIVIWVLAWLISNPLRQLATQAKNMKQTVTVNRVEKINTWYFEANELKKAFLMGLRSVHEQVGQLRIDTRTDMLTGLNNRRALEAIISHLTTEETPFSLVAVDIDHFKEVNDTYGHQAGDQVLKELATLMRSNARSNDYCIRLGGEEFLILLPNCGLDEAYAIAERLRLMVEEHVFPTINQLSISCGVAAWPLHGQSTETVFRVADEMLYAAKQSGRNQVRVAA